MRVGLLSDAHGNLAGLSEVIAALRRMAVDEIHFLGDAVGYMPEEAGCLELLESEGVVCQQGNHEAMLLGDLPVPDKAEDVYRLRDARDRLSEQAIEAISGWPKRRELELGGRRVLLVHGSPEEPLTGYIYPDSDLGPFEPLPYDLVVTANTHRPFAARAGSVEVANVGSVGLPRDAGGLASFAVYDTEGGELSVYRVRLDVARILDRFKGRVHPSVEEVLRRDDPQAVGEVLE